MGCPCPAGYSLASSTTQKTYCSNGSCQDGGTFYTKILYAQIISICLDAKGVGKPVGCDQKVGCCA